MKLWAWVVGVVLLVVSGLALVLHRISGSKSLGKLAVDSIEAVHQPKIAELHAKIDALSIDQMANHDAISKAERDVANRKADLELVYRHSGLSQAEVDAKMTELGLK